MDLLHISQMLRQARKQQQLTIAQVAAKTGLSKGFLSRLENFRITPSLNALYKVATALGLDMADLFQQNAQAPEYVFGDISKGEEIIRDNSDVFGMKYFSLAYQKLNRRMTPFIIEYHTAKKNREFLMHSSEEFFLLLEGKVEFYLFNESNCRIMTPGQTAYLASNLPHTVRLAPGESFAKALVVYREEGEAE